MIDLLLSPNAWAALLTLTVLEIVLGIDNLVFIAVLTARLDTQRAQRARAIGLSLAFIFRVAMLAGLTWLTGLTAPVVNDPRPRHFLARHHPDRRRPVPDRQDDLRHPRRGRGARQRARGRCHRPGVRLDRSPAGRDRPRLLAR